MVELPGELHRSTLGDVLGTLHRCDATGSLVLQEPPEGRRHAIHWQRGLIREVETPGEVTPLSLLLVRAQRESARPTAPRSTPAARVALRRALDSALRAQRLERLERVFGVAHARLSFAVMRRPIAAPGDPLGPVEFLHGRQRARDAQPLEPPPSQRARDLLRLDLPPDAPRHAIAARFRALAKRWHPDLHPDLPPPERRALERRFSQLVAAYGRLTAAAH